METLFHEMNMLGRSAGGGVRTCAKGMGNGLPRFLTMRCEEITSSNKKGRLSISCTCIVCERVSRVQENKRTRSVQRHADSLTSTRASTTELQADRENHWTCYLHSTLSSIDMQESTRKVPKSASQALLSGMQLTLHATCRTPHGASRLVQAMSLPGR